MERTGMDEDFLGQALRAGFDIHHMDGDHENNDPKNLVLMFGADHMMLHGMTGTLRSLRPGAGKWRDASQPKVKQKSKRAIVRDGTETPVCQRLAMPVRR